MIIYNHPGFLKPNTNKQPYTTLHNTTMSDEEIFEFTYDSEDEVHTPLSDYDDEADGYFYSSNYTKPLLRNATAIPVPDMFMYECVICKQRVTKGTVCCTDDEIGANLEYVGNNYNLWLEMAR